MANNLFVGGLPYETTQEELAKLFEACGTVNSAKLIMDRETGRSKGFGFVEMSSEAEAKAAIQKINGASLGDRTVFVSEARPQEPREPREPGAPREFRPGGSAPKPGFVERRSGKDRRQSGAAAPGERRDFGEKKPWADKKPWGDKKPFGDRRPYGEKKPWGEKKAWGDKKPFGDKKPWGEKKPWGDKKPFGDKKPWGDKKSFGDKPAFGEKKPWGDKKPWSDKKSFGDKPAFGEKKPWVDKKKPWEAMKKKADDKPGEGGGKKKWGAGGPDAGKKYAPKRKKFGSGIFGRPHSRGS